MRIVCFVFIFACGVKVSETNTLEEEYYWRDYKGAIPRDALPAGIDERGEITYIGQALFSEGLLITGVIRRGSSKVFYEYGNAAREAEKDVKIFCSPHPKRYKWIRVQRLSSIADKLNGTQLITAGHDGYGPYCIARKERGSEIAVGKAVAGGGKFDGMWYATGGDNPKSEGIYDHYEVLVFDPSVIIPDRKGPVKVVHVDFYC